MTRINFEWYADWIFKLCPWIARLSWYQPCVPLSQRNTGEWYVQDQAGPFRWVRRLTEGQVETMTVSGVCQTWNIDPNLVLTVGQPVQLREKLDDNRS